MGLEAGVKLGFKKELDNTKNETEREKLYNKLVDQAYKKGKAINAASTMEIDEVIDPKETRERITLALESFNFKEIKTNKSFIDSW